MGGANQKDKKKDYFSINLFPPTIFEINTSFFEVMTFAICSKTPPNDYFNKNSMTKTQKVYVFLNKKCFQSET